MRFLRAASSSSMSLDLPESSPLPPPPRSSSRNVASLAAAAALELPDLRFQVLFLAPLAERLLDLGHREPFLLAALDLLFHLAEVVERARASLGAELLGGGPAAGLLGARDDRPLAHLELRELLLHAL